MITAVANAFALVSVLRRESNLCKAALTCDTCHAAFCDFEFYDPPGLDPDSLLEHYAVCAATHALTAVEIRLKSETGSVTRLLFNPQTKQLSAFA